MQNVTLLFLKRQNSILLAMKKRGLGAGKWNGVGGKVVPPETFEQATARECKEEIGVIPLAISLVAVLNFYITERSVTERKIHNVAHVYLTDEWKGEPTETEEMAPRWFEIKAIPYEKMWIDDILWLPKVLAGEKIKATFVLGEQENIIDYKIEPMPESMPQ